MNVLYGLLFVALAPIIGGIVIGLDRRMTARMQGRVGPPILQPFYDVLKLFEKESAIVTRPQNLFVFAYLLFMALTGFLFFAGGDLLLVIFAMTLSEIFLVLAAYSVSSPYSFIGAERELVQLMAFEPIILLSAAGMYLATGSFYVVDIASSSVPVILMIPGLFIALACILTMKLRKSPFDLSTSHHAHQELVKGVTTEFSGSTLGAVEITHWYETVFVLGFLYLFFAFDPLLAFVAVALTYMLQIFIDNAYPRFKLDRALKSSWIITLVLGMSNVIILWLYVHGGL
ncbi:MAG: complex I subunit 1 family protein [Candidatus Aenigmatarchaeota archaeon]